MKVLSVTYGGGHVRIAAKLAQAYKARGIEYQIVAMPAAIPYLNAQGMPFKRLIDYAEYFPHWNTAYSLGEELAKTYHNPEIGFSFEDTICYYGLSYYDLIAEHGEQKARELFEKSGRKAFYPKQTAKIIIKAENPDMIQTTCGQRMELAVSDAAKELNILSARIQDTPMLYEKIATDYLFTINETEKARNTGIMKDWEKKIITTGHPCLEDYSKINKEAERAKVEENLKIGGKYLITWAIPGRPTNYTDETFLILRNTAINNPEISIVIKLHPTSHSNDMFEKYGELPQNMRIVKRYDLPGLLKASDLVIGGTSTTAFEAILLDCNEIVIVRGETGHLNEPNYYNYYYLENLDDLEKEINLFLTDEETKRAAAERRKGLIAVRNASENVADAMIKIYEETRNTKDINFNAPLK